MVQCPPKSCDRDAGRRAPRSWGAESLLPEGHALERKVSVDVGTVDML